ncbi:hypothetical protein GCM10010185_25410 [Saccharothrix coeruleofusca]|uniref:Ankyrin repeat protein n=2 Tax=Saccharothrix coeruleofusca TaxID=33919 RepID=A0A918ECS3_9PSEU|nr:hypothetical protein GCM10010185_25410 [Saccharothrix coeruleofusca]
MSKSWSEAADIRAVLDSGADPNAPMWGDYGRPLHIAAEHGSPEVAALLASRVTDVDAEEEGRTALWRAVHSHRPDNARVLAEAGADPWRPMMAGWSPGRLALAGPEPDLFGAPPEGVALSEREVAAAAEAPRLIAALGDFYLDGMSLACVAGIDAAEAARRLGAVPVADGDAEDDLAVVGATDVPGGCVVLQPRGFAAQMSAVLTALSEGTACYGFYANPKSGDQGSVARDGVLVDWDLDPGGGVSEHDPSEYVLASYLYQDRPVAHSCAYAGLRLTGTRAVAGPPDVWLRLPEDLYGPGEAAKRSLRGGW